MDAKIVFLKVDSDEAIYIVVGYFNLIAIDANVQVYTINNKVMNIQDRLHRD